MSADEIFVALGEDGYEYCHPVDPDDFETINREINGKPKGAEWVPLQMELVEEDDRRSLLRSDSPWLGDHALIFRAEAILALGERLGRAGELLPLTCRKARLFMFNPLQALPALDESASTLARFEDGRIMMVQKYVFVRELLNNVDAFKLSNLRVSPTFLSKRIVEAWQDCGLTGLKFRRIG